MSSSFSGCRFFTLNCFTRFYSVKRPVYDSGRPFRAKKIPQDVWIENKDPKYTDYEEVKDHWHYVEQLFPKLRIPPPPKQFSSTGWKTQSEKLPDLPYFVERTRNHMLPVYDCVETVKCNPKDDKFFTTKVKKVHGDIYVFEYDLKNYLEQKSGSKIESHVSEIGCWVTFEGDRIEEIKEWLYRKGF